MTQLNRRDFFRLDNTDGKSYFGFVRSGRDLVTLILLDPDTNTLKNVIVDAGGGKNFIKLPKSDMPAILKKAYDECFVTVKKGATVTFNFNGEDYTGVVVKGGANPKVEVTIDNKLCYTSGPAVLFKVVEEQLKKVFFLPFILNVWYNSFIHLKGDDDDRHSKHDGDVD